MKWYTTGWLVWIGLFVAIEGAALVDKRKGDTLSEHVRQWASLRHKAPGWKIRRGALAAFLVWLTYHLYAEGDDG